MRRTVDLYSTVPKMVLLQRQEIRLE
jgi:hypothetical protein